MISECPPVEAVEGDLVLVDRPHGMEFLIRDIRCALLLDGEWNAPSCDLAEGFYVGHRPEDFGLFEGPVQFRFQDLEYDRRKFSRWIHGSLLLKKCGRHSALMTSPQMFAGMICERMPPGDRWYVSRPFRTENLTFEQIHHGAEFIQRYVHEDLHRIVARYLHSGRPAGT